MGALVQPKHTSQHVHIQIPQERNKTYQQQQQKPNTLNMEILTIPI